MTVEETHIAITKEMYLIFKDHQSNKNWVSNEASWDTLAETEKEFWLDYVKTVLKKVRLEALSQKEK